MPGTIHRTANRREFLRGVGAFAGAAAFGGCGLPAGAAPGPALRIDAHCHVFNGRDLPIYGLLESVVVEQNVFGIFAEPIALWLALTIEGSAPTYEQEKEILDRHLIPNPAATAEYKRNSERAEEFLEKGLKKFIDRYTSFGPQATRDANDRNDGFVLELLVRYGGLQDQPKAEAVQQLQKEEFRRQIIKRLLDANATQQKGFFDGFGEYLRQFSLWSTRFIDYRFQLADDLGARFGDGGDELRIMTPAIVDFGKWPLKARFPEHVTPIHQQAELLHKIALIQPAGRKIHGFIGFDPWHYLDNANALSVVKKAVTDWGFVGIKLYPPMGFRATNNKDIDPREFPKELRDRHRGPGLKLDRALARLYAYCNDEQLAIMAHCADTIGSQETYAKRAAPEHWKTVLRDYPRMRVNLGHFGGIWDYLPDDTCRRSTQTTWPKQIAAMVKTHPNLYADVGDFAEVLERWDSEKCATPKIFARLKQLLKNNRGLASRIMYGSDWMMLDREPRNENYYSAMRQHFAGILAGAELNGFLGQNAAAFLGLQRGHPTRQRIADFYRRNNRSVPDFDRYLSS